jgi:hypothetical protein
MFGVSAEVRVRFVRSISLFLFRDRPLSDLPVVFTEQGPLRTKAGISCLYLPSWAPEKSWQFYLRYGRVGLHSFCAVAMSFQAPETDRHT